jgi:hypothetical protein
MNIKNSFAEVRKGQRFKVIKNTNGHNYPIGKVLTFKRNGPHSASMSDAAVGMIGNNLKFVDIILLGISIEDLKANLANVEKSLKTKMKVLENQLKFCEKYNLEEYDPLYYHIGVIEEILEKDISNFEKAKEIISTIRKVDSELSISSDEDDDDNGSEY